ncbi:hypothetical protein CDL15_Pgr025345 [Punica granatum]|uniref:Uncharacterized protein n=1 Tax=Punica granatum TaxID=22663 RepID=A0A218W9K9_PUNGR|nr:hypothetical protein CDL15_Pgr025345 [Punica granatum]
MSNLGSTIPSGSGISLGGSVYWLGTPYHRGWMVRFLVAKEEFGYLSCLGKRLGLAEFSLAGHINVWASDEYRQAWEKKWEIDLSVSPLLLKRCSRSVMGGSSFDIIGTLNRKIVLRVRKHLFSYDPRSRKIERIRCSGLDPNAMPYCVRGSLVSLSRFNFRN